MLFAFGCRRAGFRAAGRLLVFWLTLLLGVAGAGALCPLGAYAQSLVPPDSVVRHTVQLAETRVEADALRTSAGAPSPPGPGSYITTLDAVALRSLGAGASLGAVLAQRTPLAVRQYGPGQLASLSVRGTTAQHVAVLWQGFNISFPTLGQADMALLPAASLTSATLLHGPAAARLGSGAVGGALTLVTGTPVAAGQARYEAAVSGGSFGQQAASARVAAGWRRHAFSTSVQAGRAENNYPYRLRTFRGWRTDTVENAKTASYAVTHDQQPDLGPDWRPTAAAWLTGADRQLAPPLNTAPTNAREHDASRRLVLGLRYRGNSYLRVASLTDVINYADQLTGPSDARSRSWQAQAGHALGLGHGSEARVGAEAQHFRARVDGYGPLLKTEHRAAAFGELAWARTGGSATLTVRQAAIPGQRAPPTPAVGAEWRLPKTPVQLRAGAVRAYRAPTLNERY
ncbi:MAG: TonB-dependent receptor, partial [Hymenobacteraceae bacterium]|nr:TonB-dependent receptor [Hymenobacteraceae bacterium]